VGRGVWGCLSRASGEGERGWGGRGRGRGGGGGGGGDGEVGRELDVLKMTCLGFGVWGLGFRRTEVDGFRV
jgi:hypothetical protein